MVRMISILVLFTVSVATPQIPKEQFIQRREAVKAQLRPGEGMVLLSRSAPIRSRDTAYEFRPNSDFWYLTGLGEPDAALLLTDRDVSISLNGETYWGQEFLFLREKDPHIEQWIGELLGVDAASWVLGIQNVLPNTAFEEAMPLLLKDIRTLYHNLRQVEALRPAKEIAELTLWWTPRRPPRPRKWFPINISRYTEKQHRAYARKILPRHRRMTFKNAGEIIHQLRLRKSPEELELIQRAIDITGKALGEVFGRVKPGLWEYQAEATIEYEFKDNGAQRVAYPSIVGSGPNALVFHYDKSIRQMQAGDLLLMDVGAEYDMYAADITRTIPVDGTFTPTQRELYELTLEAQTAATAVIRPGATLADVIQAGKKVIEDAGYIDFYYANISHHIGLDVHDVGNRETPFEPGMVFTIEPGLYIPADTESVPEAYRGIGIRVEDDFLVTEEGGIMLSRDIPRTVDEIEAMMKE